MDNPIRKDTHRRSRYAAWLALASLVGLSGVGYWQHEKWQDAVYSALMDIADKIPMFHIREI
jgi:hypothetical protein